VRKDKVTKLAHKVAVAHTLFDRACSGFPDSEKEKERVAKALLSNVILEGL